MTVIVSIMVGAMLLAAFATELAQGQLTAGRAE